MSSEAEKYIGRQKSLCSMQGAHQLNYKSLLDYLNKLANPEFVITSEKKTVSDTESILHIELTRHTHNYLASGASLVEHTRNLMKQSYSDTDLFSEYKVRIQEQFANCPTSSFLKDLRNYMLHKGTLPGIIKIEASNVVVSHYRLKRLKLNSYRKWSASSKVFLAEQTEDIDLIPVVTFYNSKIVRFHNWLNSELKKYHQNDLSKFEARNVVT